MKETIDIPVSVTYRIEDGKIIETRRKVKNVIVLLLVIMMLNIMYL